MHPTSDHATPEVLKAITMQNQLKSPLLRLPAEIRNQIYKYSLYDTYLSICQAGSGCPITHKFCSEAQECQRSIWAPRVPIDWSLRCRHHQHLHFPKDRLQLLLVCQQIYTEARLLVFSSNTLTGRIPQVDFFLLENNWSADQMNAIKTVKLVCGLHEICLAAGKGTGKMVLGPNQSLQGFSNARGLEKVIFHLLYYGTELEAHKAFETRVKKLLEVAINEGLLVNDTVKFEYVFEQQE